MIHPDVRFRRPWRRCPKVSSLAETIPYRGGFIARRCPKVNSAGGGYNVGMSRRNVTVGMSLVSEVTLLLRVTVQKTKKFRGKETDKENLKSGRMWSREPSSRWLPGESASISDPAIGILSEIRWRNSASEDRPGFVSESHCETLMGGFGRSRCV